MSMQRARWPPKPSARPEHAEDGEPRDVVEDLASESIERPESLEYVPRTFRVSIISSGMSVTLRLN